MKAAMQPGPHKVRITEHARMRMDQMGLTRTDVLAVLWDPVLDYPGPAKYGPNQRIATRDHLAVVYHPTERHIITVLWNHQDFVRPEKEGVSVDG